jgi:prepilin-type N-terminal cleavage/methylation domain-containing protein
MEIKAKKRGFTLIEMLIVVAIIGLLATIVLFAVSRARKKALATKMKADMEMVMKALEMAASDGCASVDTYGFGTDTSLQCTPPGRSDEEIYIERVPGEPAMCPNCDYSESTERTSTVNYYLKATGFSKGEFECKNGICYCTISDSDGCVTIN